MASHAAEVLTGAAVIAAAAGFVWYVSQGSGFIGSGATYPLKASFRSVEGVTLGTDVRLAGVKVGTVTALSLNPETFYADATLTVQDSVRLPQDSTALISSEGLLGGSFVELQPGGDTDVLGPGDEIVDTQGAVSVISLLMKFAAGNADGKTDGAAGAPAE